MIGFFFVVWLLVAIGCGAIAQGKNRSFAGWLILGAIFGVFALLIIACMPRWQSYLDTPEGMLDSGRAAKCPDCAELIQPEARVCRHCGMRFTEEAPPIFSEARAATTWQKLWWKPEGRY